MHDTKKFIRCNKISASNKGLLKNLFFIQIEYEKTSNKI